MWRCSSAAVLGSGVMGSGIAAHLAGAGIKTLLLDIVPSAGGAGGDKKARNALALGGLERALKAKPAAFYDPDARALVQAGNLEDDLEALRRCDLVIEAVTEKIEIKQSLFARVAPHLRADVILASNTSGLSIAQMSQNLPDTLQRQFVVMHFFNPVRYMRLLEVVPGPKTDPKVIGRVVGLGEALGKGVVFGKDTPNFIGNRIGTYGLMRMVQVMQEHGLSIEEVDKVMGKAMGRPASAAFRTIDLVGLDTFLHVAKNCHDNLPNDEERQVFQPPPWMERMAAAGQLGQKSGAGFYKKVGPEILVLDLASGEYRAQKKVKFESLGQTRGIEDVGERIRALVNFDDAAGRFAWASLAPCLAYAARRIGEIADDVVNVDRALRWGFNWDVGPFESWDAIGVAAGAERMAKDGIAVPQWVEQMLKAGRTSFYAGGPVEPTYFNVAGKKPAPVPKSPETISLAAVHQDKKRVVEENLGASLLDLGDGCLCLEFHTKMNTIDGDVVALINSGVERAERDFEALVVANDGPHFGAGANLMLIYLAAQQQDFKGIADTIDALQAAVQRLRYARVPTVAAPFNLTLGGSCEVAMACDACQAHAETYMGLVEVGVGVIPAGGGCLRLLERFSQPLHGVDGVDLLPFIGQASLQIATAKVSTGAEEARALRYLSPTDGVSLNRDEQLWHSKQRALGMAHAGYRPPLPRPLRAAGWDAARTIGVRVWGMVESGAASEHDALIANHVAKVLCGGEVAAGQLISEADVLALEREAFVALCREEKTQARMQSILMTNKPLRN